MSETTVSIVLTVYNGERWLPEAIDSLLRQTYGDFELVVVDDGSADRTAGILERYAHTDSRVRVLRQVNQGQAPARNAGIAAATGTYVALMDADDECLPRRLELQKAFLDSHSRVACVGSGIEIIDEHGKHMGYMTAPTGESRCRQRLLDGRYYNMGASLMVRREAALEVGGFRKPFKQRNDADFMLRMAERYGIDNVREPLYRYRINMASQSVSRIEEALWENRLVWELHRERLAGRCDRLQKGETIESPFSREYKGTVGAVRDSLAYIHLGEVEIAMEEKRWFGAARHAWRAFRWASGKRKILRNIVALTRNRADCGAVEAAG